MPLLAQIKKVNYQLKFNSQTSLYDCYIQIAEGSAFTKKERIQFNAQVSIVLPAESEMSIVKTYMPLQNNINFGGTRAANWYVTNKVERPDQLQHANIVSVTPDLAPTGHYNELRAGEEVKLFSFKVSPLPLCGEGVRIFDNDSDPNSASPGMRGGDFSNGFTIGGITQKYGTNLPAINTALPQGELKSVKQAITGETIVLEAGNWQNASAFTWSGPNGFSYEGKDVVLPRVTPENAGKYTLTVASALGCTATGTINLKVSSAEDFEQAVASTNAANIESTAKATAQGVKVFPNPASSFINISVNAVKGSSVKADIYSVDGRLVMSNVISQTMDANVMEKNIPLKLQSGVYAVKLNINGEESDHRFICVE